MKFKEIFLPTPAPRMEGWITCQAIRRGTIVRERMFQVTPRPGIRQAGPFHNMITDMGMNRLGSTGPNTTYRYMHVGTGTTAPNVDDTSLANFLANVSGDQPVTASGNSGSPNYFGWRTLQWTTTVGQLGNVNLTEIGISGQTTNGLLFSRELIRDSGGVPTSFPVADDEQFRGIYELRIYVPQSDVVTTTTISSSSHDLTIRAHAGASNVWAPAPVNAADQNFATANASAQTAFSGDMVAFTSATNPTGTLGNATSISQASYSPGTFSRDATITFGSATGNGNIRTVIYNTQRGAVFQYRFDPVIAKTSLQQLVLLPRLTWARR